MNKPCIAMVFFLFVAGNDCSITDNTVDSSGCEGKNLTIYWEYSDASNMDSVVWEFISGSTTTIILVQSATGAAIVQNNFNVEHVNNGEIKLTDLASANVGTYKITVAYSSATPSASDTFEVTAVHDAPTGLSFTDVGSVVTCSATSSGSPPAQLYLKVEGTDTGLTSDTIDEGSGKAVECCLKGDSVECLTTPACVTVRSKTPGKKCWCLVKCDIPVCVICWIIIIIVVEFIIGAILGCFMYCNGGRYDCFNTEGQLPRFFKILAFSFIFSAVALGIYVVWRCIGRQEVRYVVVEHDGNGSLGFNHGSVIVTSVTPGGPADNKLKVGEHVRKVGEESTEGKTLEEIHRMLNNKTSLTLAVSKVGSDDTRSVLIRYNQGEQLGFVADICIMVSNVQAGGPADGKLKVGQRVLSINGKSTARKSNKEIKKWLKPTSNSIKLSIKKASGQEETVELHYDNKASLGIEIDKNESQQIVVSTVKKNSTAAESIQKGDHILKVNGESTQNMTVAKVRGKMKSSVGFKVTKDVTLLELDPDINGSVGLDMCPANTVTSVTLGGSAATAGIKRGQKILSINGENTDGMSQEKIIEVLHSSKKSVTLKLGEGSSPDVKHTATSKSRHNTRSSNEKSSPEKPADQLPLPEISHASGTYGGSKTTSFEIENDTVSYSKQKLPPTGHEVPGHHFHEKLPDIQQN